MLGCIYHNGILVEWKVTDWTVAKKVAKKELTFEASTFNHANNSTLVYAHNPQTSINYLQEFTDNNVTSGKNIQVDMKITTVVEVVIKKERSAFLLAL